MKKKVFKQEQHIGSIQRNTANIAPRVLTRKTHRKLPFSGRSLCGRVPASGLEKPKKNVQKKLFKNETNILEHTPCIWIVDND